MAYRWLLLDADGTLFDYDRAELQALRLTFGGAGHPFQPAYAEAYRRINAAIWRDFELGQISQARLRTRRFELLFEDTGLPLEAEGFARDYLRYLAQGVDLVDGAEEVLCALQGRVGLALITNGLQDVQRPRLAGSAIGHLFDAVIISEEVGAAKPDPAIFQAAFERMGHPPREQVLMVGDSLTSDVQGAINYGLAACWFNPGGQPRPSGVDIRHEIQDLSELPSLLGLEA